MTKEEIAFAKLIENFQFLIADPASSRRSIRKLLSYYLVKPNHVDVVETHQDAYEFIEAKKPHVVFADYDVLGEEGHSLLYLHQKTVLAPQKRAFFLISAKASDSIARNAADDDVDSVLVKPFTFQALQDQFTEVMQKKYNPKPYQESIDTGRSFLELNELDKALEKFRQAKTQDPNPSLACYYEGVAMNKLNSLEGALSCFDEGLSFNQTHYRCLLGRLDALLAKQDYANAYETGKIIATNHSVPMKRIPDFIRLSILNKKFEDVLSFYKQIDGVGEIDSEAAKYISAGLVVCGLYFIKLSKSSDAIAAFRKAEIIGQKQPIILKRIFSGLLISGMETEARAFLMRMPDEIRDSTEIKLTEFDALSQAGEGFRCLEFGLRLLKEGIKDLTLYERLINKSIELKRKKSMVEELVWGAIKDFPEKKNYFEEVLVKNPELSNTE